jgi:IclR family transcriptional regulator, acetate operon repressor
MNSERPMGILQKSSDLIERLAARGPLTPAEIAEEIGMPRSSVYRLAEALGQVQMTETLPYSRIKVSLRWLRLADAARAAMVEWTNARSVLDKLAHDTGQTTFLSVPRGDEVVCIDWSQGRGINVLILKPGRTLPLYAGAAGRVTLAFRDEDPAAYLAQAPFPAFTRRTLRTASQLRSDIASIRGRGFSISDEDVTEGIGALGVPLFGATGSLRGALSLAGLAEDIRTSRMELVDHLQASASVLSARLG